MSHIERRDRAVRHAENLIASVPRFVAKDQYGLAALTLRQATEAMRRAYDEQTCIDLNGPGARSRDDRVATGVRRHLTR